MSKLIKSVKPFILLMILTMSIIAVFFFMKRSAIYNNLSVTLIKDSVEYGENINEKDLVSYSGKYLTVKDQIDTSVVGDYEIEYVVYGVENLFKTSVKKPYKFTIHVIDTNYPIIEIINEEVSVYVNSDYDFKENISKIYDLIDGDILDYSIESDVDFTKVGTYSVNITAKDKNNLVSNKSYNLIVKNRPSISVNDNYYYIYNYLMNNYGYNKAATCAILANIKYESTFNPLVGGYYYGLIQWGGSRKDNLFNYCNNNGLDYETIDGQLQFMQYELSNFYPSVYNYLYSLNDSASGAKDGAIYFCNVYEGAASNAGRGDLAYSYYESQ